jgi:hypothetical protein
MVSARHQAALAFTSPAGFAKSTHGAKIAQLVEQLIRNQQVVGSIPILGSILDFLCVFAILLN